MATLSLNDSYMLRDELTEDSLNAIRELYQDLYRTVKAEADNINTGRNISSAMREDYLRGLEQQLSTAVNNIGSLLEESIPADCVSVASGVAYDNSAWLEQNGLAIAEAWSHIPQQAVDAVLNGTLYPPDAAGNRWTFSNAIWQDVQKTTGDINQVIAAGIAGNRSALDIARDLERYVNPDAAKPWDWGKRYPGSKQQIDYNAQRLARTMMNHAYQYALVACTTNNPFVNGYIWHSVHDPQTCPICELLDGQKFEKGTLPLDHPNGLCYWEMDIPDSYDQIVERLGDWVNGADDPAIDRYMADLAGRLPNTVANALAKELADAGTVKITEELINNYIRENGTPKLWRGVGGSDAGGNIYGDGVYVGNTLGIANAYAGRRGNVFEVTVKKEAKILEIKSKMDWLRLKQKLGSEGIVKRLLYKYDGYVVKGAGLSSKEDYWVITNRDMLLMSAEPHDMTDENVDR